jgi:hypothetical protein
MKIILSWFLTALGFLVGVFALSMFGMNWIPSADRSSGWFMPWLPIAGNWPARTWLCCWINRKANPLRW